MIKTLKLKEKIDREIETLDEEQLREVANFISFLKFKSRLNHQTDFNLERVSNLYKEVRIQVLGLTKKPDLAGLWNQR